MDAQTLYNHYTDSNEQQKGFIQKRDKLTICLLLGIVVFAFLLAEPSSLTEVANAYLKETVKVEGNILNFHILNTGIIYVILWYLLQYYQVCLTIERQYDYINDLEDKLSNTEYKIEREGKSYAKNYPLLKNFANILYAWGIPAGVCVFSICRFIEECKQDAGYVWIDCIGFSVIAIISLLYISDRDLDWSYFNRKKHTTLPVWKRIVGFFKIDVEEAE